MKYHLLLAFLFPILNISNLAATHINGGYIQVTAVEQNETSTSISYKLVLFRDCNCVNCPTIEERVTVGLYIANEGDNIYNLSQENISNSQFLELSKAEQIDVPFSMSNICLEQGTYEGEFVINRSTEENRKYYIVYQRCCRSRLINNLLEADDTGITIFTEITDRKGSLKNNGFSIIDTFKPFTKVGETFQIPFSLENVNEQDSLAFRLCAPLAGGGKENYNSSPKGDPSGCNGIIPNPPCPPPYQRVTYVESLSASNPLPISSTINVDSTNGNLNGIINQIGTFQIGVCVAEYRNDTLIQESVIDFVLTSLPEDITYMDNFVEDGISIELSPNPIFYGQNAALHITNPKFQKLDIALFNSHGQLLYRKKAQKIVTMELPTPENAGIYFIKVITQSGKSAVLKLVKL